MNHIYKVIWNYAKHCYTVVSEIAKNHSTSSVTKKKVSIAAILAAGMLSGFSPMVSGAADTIVYDQNGTSLKSTNSSVGKNAIALGKGASAVDDSIAIGNGASVVEGGSHGKGGVALGNDAHAGYKGTSLGNGASSGREGTIVIGDTTKASSLYSTVVGTNSKITSDGTAYTVRGNFFGIPIEKSVNVQGAVSTSYGASNTITNTEKAFSGVANSIIGSVNTVTNSNGVTIQGTGNTVSNAYKGMKFELGNLWDFSNGDYSAIAKQGSGAIAIIGGGNAISNQTSSTVIGFGNTLNGENSTGVFTAGSHNTLTNVSNSLVMGDNNELEGRNNVISLGNKNKIEADNAVAIGNGTKVKAEAEGGVAIGVGSVASIGKGVLGAFAPDTIPEGAESTWTSTEGAVSVGDTEGKITRQITNVAAGKEATDAVNVAQLAQLKKALDSISTEGLTIQDGPSVTGDGIDGGNKQVTNVAAGDISADSTYAVNGSQLFATNQQVAQNAQSISKLGNRINKVGAGAAALAALHPLDFDPDDKWDFAAGYGNYNGENAAAIGAYYRPNEDTMLSVGGSFGNGENMVNAGVSLKLGQGNHVSTSKVAMAKEIKDLRKELEGLKSALLDVNAGKKVDTSKLQLFPDVPKNHWAYEYVSTLKGNGALTGYPDGEFKGDRPMTRYEFATMLYKAMLEGATLSDRILKEFAPELERFTVDTVHQNKDGKPTVERVRTVKAEK